MVMVYEILRSRTVCDRAGTLLQCIEITQTLSAAMHYLCEQVSLLLVISKAQQFSLFRFRGVVCTWSWWVSPENGSSELQKDNLIFKK